MLKRYKYTGLFLLSFLALAIPSGILISNALYKPKVFDCFLFFNEFDVLDIRLNELNDKVDKFILVESTKGFTNKDKPLYFSENKERYAKFLDKIVHVVVDEFPEFGPVGDTDYWEIENFQRNQIMKGLKSCHPHNRDIVIVTDLDEIIRNNKVDKIVNLIDRKSTDLVYGNFDFYKFFVNRKVSASWDIVVATSWENLSKYILNTQSFRNLKGFVGNHAYNGFEVLEAVKRRHPHKKWSFANIKDLGWHFTSIGSFEKYMQKLGNYSHIQEQANAKDFNVVKNQVARLEWCEITDKFPKYIIANKEILEIRGVVDKKETTYKKRDL